MKNYSNIAINQIMNTLSALRNATQLEGSLVQSLVFVDERQNIESNNNIVNNTL